MPKITNIRTVRVKEYSNSLWLEIGTDDGLTGLGEAWRGAETVEKAIHSEIAPYLLGKDARQIERISRDLLTPYVGYHSSGAEIRAASAVDIALWDLFGKRAGIPVCEALGGACREEMQVYNTCSGYSYNANASSVALGAGRRIVSSDDELRGPYDDQVAFIKDAGVLAKSLLSEGYRAMKIWPFDPYAIKTGGNFISDEDLQKGLEPFRKIREAVGNSMEVMCELHSMWNIPAAARICRALEEYDILWAEDPLCKMDDQDALLHLKGETGVPICGCETLSGTVIFRNLLNAGALDYAMLDLGWCGGLTEGRKIVDLAASFNIPTAPHDCTGPVLLWAGMQLAFHSVNAVFMEVVRANLATWYKDVVDCLPEINLGMAKRPEKAGIGASLRPEIKSRSDVSVRETGL